MVVLGEAHGWWRWFGASVEMCWERAAPVAKSRGRQLSGSRRKDSSDSYRASRRRLKVDAAECHMAPGSRPASLTAHDGALSEEASHNGRGCSWGSPSYLFPGGQAHDTLRAAVGRAARLRHIAAVVLVPRPRAPCDRRLSFAGRGGRGN